MKLFSDIFSILMSINFMMTIMFLLMNHPMSMGLILMIQTISISLISGFYSYSFWFSYILFIIMVGGMLVLFMYMTSLASNEKFKFSNKTIIISMLMFFIAALTFNIDQFMMNPMFKNNNLMENISNFILYKNENINSLMIFYNNPNSMITIMLMNYLLITLIAVVKITKSNQGSLRQKF
uniref:NADH dehydrogenase subunit 6 n=1 Tax=Hyphydrus ovatus TaxID=159814 RepID=UPI00202946BD|nr:NADH dehydrogenase subunit 6 [Hyphydrus ovatus]UPL65081.1 NADH dehydrogenase subunit 6 [Hyphydrus ovatus]